MLNFIIRNWEIFAVLLGALIVIMIIYNYVAAIFNVMR